MSLMDWIGVGIAVCLVVALVPILVAIYVVWVENNND